MQIEDDRNVNAITANTTKKIKVLEVPAWEAGGKGATLEKGPGL